MKGMEEGRWDLSKVDYDEVEKSQVAMVFGQMNEPPGIFSLHWQGVVTPICEVKNISILV